MRERCGRGQWTFSTSRRVRGLCVAVGVHLHCSSDMHAHSAQRAARTGTACWWFAVAKRRQMLVPND